MRLAAIFVYPVKGARGISLDRARVLRSGVEHDRRFMVIGARGTFLTQRTHPRLALVETALEGAPGDEAVVVGAPRLAPVALPRCPDGPRRRVRVWDDEVEAVSAGPEAADFFSQHLGEPCDLVFMPEDVVRPVEAPYGRPGDRVGFADAYPLLLTAQASLDDLNARLATPVPMDRFRPSVVVEGGAPFDEERFGVARIGALAFRMPKGCARCEVVTVDQATAKIGREPLRTLAKYRRRDNHVLFGQNLVPDGEGAIAVGDPVRYLDAG